MTDKSTDALFMALANAQEARLAARALNTKARGRPGEVTMPPNELISALHLIDKTLKELGATAQLYCRVVNSAAVKQKQPSNASGADRRRVFSLRAIAYDVAKELDALGRYLRRGAPVANSISAATAYDIALTKEARRTNNT